MNLAQRLYKVYPLRSSKTVGLSTEVKELTDRFTQHCDADSVAVVDVDNRLTLDNLNVTKLLNCVVNLRLVNRLRHIVPFFVGVNDNLEEGGVFICCVETAEQRKIRLYRKFPKGFRTIYYTFDYLGKRVAPKLPFFKTAYYFLTAGRNRVLTRVEVLGRLAYCGFEIMEEVEIENKHFIIVKKQKSVPKLEEKNYGLLFKMKRHGYKGKMIDVYKFRSMYAYSEYLQDFIYKENELAEGGKFKEDYRVNMLGKLIRKFWIDELPMLYNFFKGEIKLVGVRPLSEHYLSLYGKEFAELRKAFKPGLIPPYYADMPNTIEEIKASEEKYFIAYQKSPFKTDVRYFFKCLSNIIIRKARSN